MIYLSTSKSYIPRHRHHSAVPPLTTAGEYLWELLLNRPKYGDHEDITQIHEVRTLLRMEYQRAAWPSQTQWYTDGMYYLLHVGRDTECEGLSQGAMTWLAPNYAKR